MQTTKDLKLARLLKVGLDILFGGFLIACVALVLWMVLSPTIIRQAGIPGTVSVPVTVGIGEEPQIEVKFASPPNDNISAAYVEQTEGTLLLETMSIQMIVISNAAKLVLAIGLTYIFFLLRGIVQAILDGKPFEAANVRRIRLLGYGVLVVGISVQVVEYIAATEILNKLPMTVPVLSTGSALDPGLILAALFILLLAHIWSYGLELEHDRALTV